MSLSQKIIPAFAAFVLSVSPALAMTIENFEASERIATVKVGDKTTEFRIGPGAMVEHPCKPECKVSVAGITGALDAEPRDKVVIRNGDISVDGE